MFDLLFVFFKSVCSLKSYVGVSVLFSFQRTMYVLATYNNITLNRIISQYFFEKNFHLTFNFFCSPQYITCESLAGLPILLF